MAAPDHLEEFVGALRTSLANNAFQRLTLGKYRGVTTGLKQVQVRPIETRKGPTLSARIRYQNQDLTESINDLEPRLRSWIEEGFRSAHLHTTSEDIQLEFNKRGRARMSRGRPTLNARDHGHDREKRRLVSPDRPYLRALGITSNEGNVLPSKHDKWKQINRYLEVFAAAFRASPLLGQEKLHVLDFGSGKGYLTFALHDFLRRQVGEGVTTTGVELRSDLARKSDEAARACGSAGLEFQAGDIAGFESEAIDIMVALHACDIATDLALFQGIRKRASLIMSAPCCHQEIRPQIRIPKALQTMLRHGIHLGTEADSITDSMRASLLEASGYRVKVFEFISLEHTSKNKMIVATKDASIDADQARAGFRELRDFYGIQSQKLAELLEVQ